MGCGVGRRGSGAQEVSHREFERSLLEIGPRFVLTPIRVFRGPMGGSPHGVIWGNPKGAHNELLSPSR